MKITNFGGNVAFTPTYYYTPVDENEVLDILNKHAAGRIRARASMHAWSDAIVSNDVCVNLMNLNSIVITKQDDGSVAVQVGSGCTLADLITSIEEKTETTIPTLGAIKSQTIAGAISTGTHGTGKPSLSHYIESVRIAAFDKASGKAKIFEYNSGVGLEAARCSLGCMGVILSVKFHTVPQYWVEEKVVRRASLKEVLSSEEAFPLQQFALFPYLWKYFVYQRRPFTAKPNYSIALNAIYRLSDVVSTEFLAHVILKLILLLSSIFSSLSLVTWFYKKLVSALMITHTYTNKSTEGLTLHTTHHDMFQHLEMEVFVKPEYLGKAVKTIENCTNVFAGLQDDVDENIREELCVLGMYESALEYKGSYAHHYPFFIRRILPDATLISPSSGESIYYSISFFTYHAPHKREAFYTYAAFMAKVLNKMCKARLHMGKYHPLTYPEIDELYPRMGEFQTLCNEVDPNGVFRNDFTKRVLGLS